MANSKKEVLELLDEIRRNIGPAVRRENIAIRAAARADGIERPERWDRYYYEERIRAKEQKISDKQLKSYLTVDNILKGVLALSEDLFDLEFKPNKTAETWHSDVITLDAHHKQTGEKLGTFMFDLYARPHKGSNAWCTTTMTSGWFDGQQALPVIPIVCNYTKGAQGEPSSTNINGSMTLFHETGHAIQALLTTSKYQSLSAHNNVPWDIVEFFSQIFENWSIEPEILDLYARHHKTGRPLPKQTKEKIQNSRAFMGGNALRFALQITYLDLALHSRNLKKDSLSNHELKTLTKLFPGHSQQYLITPVFQHIATLGYDSGYYSYIWAEAAEAIGFERFEQAGLRDRESAKALVDFMKAVGTEDPNVLFVDFSGNSLHPYALLKRYGIVKDFNTASQPTTPEQNNQTQTRNRAGLTTPNYP